MSEQVPPVPLPPVLDGRYRLSSVIGRGGASVVYRASDLLLGREVAIKAFTARATDHQEIRVQEGEARLLGSMNHPGLVTLLDAGIDVTDVTAPQMFLVMEYVQGSDLRERLRHGALDAGQVAYLGFDLSGALGYVHQHGIIHRDLKPANVLLVDSGEDRPLRAKLADFGIALLQARDDVEEEFTTGTAAYLSPEQVEGRALGPETDVYSLGLVLLEALTGRAAFPGSVLDSALARLDVDPEIPAFIPKELSDLLARMTARAPSDRPTPVEANELFRAILVDTLAAGRPQAHDPEAARLEAVRRYDLLDTPPDGAFDRITSLASRLFDVPVSIVSIVDADRVWFKSHHGIEITEVERSTGLATSGGLHDQTLVITDMQADSRVAGMPMTAGAHDLRFYAGVPLITPEGHNLGVLAVIDWKPHTWAPDKTAVLEDLAAMVLHEMELRLAARRIALGRR
jgi:serine/threonine protein kinase